MNLALQLLAAVFFLGVHVSEGAIEVGFSEAKAMFRVRSPSKRIEQLRTLSEFLVNQPKKPSVEHVVVDGSSERATQVHIESYPDEAPLQVQSNRAIVTNEGVRRKRSISDDRVAHSLASTPEGFFAESALPPSISPSAGAAAEVSSGASSMASRLRQVPLNPSRTDNIVPFDAEIDPDFPIEAPVARGLYNIPEGHNLDKDIDVDFRTGFRHGPPSSVKDQQDKQQMTSGKFYVPSTFNTPYQSMPMATYGSFPAYGASAYPGQLAPPAFFGYSYPSYLSNSYPYYMG